MVSEILDWMELNKTLVFLGVALIGITTYKLTQYIKSKKQQKLGVQEDVPPEQPTFPVTGSIGPDSIHLEENFSKVNLMEVSNLEHLENFLEYTHKEIKDKKNTYIKAKERYKELIEIEARLRTHIPMLEEQARIIQKTIDDLKEKNKPAKPQNDS